MNRLKSIENDMLFKYKNTASNENWNFMHQKIIITVYFLCNFLKWKLDILSKRFYYVLKKKISWNLCFESRYYISMPSSKKWKQISGKMRRSKANQMPRGSIFHQFHQSNCIKLIYWVKHDFYFIILLRINLHTHI